MKLKGGQPLAKSGEADFVRGESSGLAVLFGCCALALALRLWGLETQSITVDELYELQLVKKTVPEIILAHDGFPPLYELLLKAWMTAFGPFSARSFSVLCAVSIVPAVWLLAGLAGGRRAATFGALLVAISPVHIWYAQESRAYALFSLFAVLAAYCFFCAMENGRRVDWAAYVATAVMGLYTHYYFALVIAGLWVTVPTFSAWRTRLFDFFAAHALTGVLCLPWAWLLIDDLKLQSDYFGAPNWPLDLKSLAYTFLTFMAGYSVGPSTAELHVARGAEAIWQVLPWASAAVIVAGLALWPLRQAGPARLWAVRFALLIAVPILACGAAAALFNLGYRVRYVVWGASILLAMLGLGLARGGRAVSTIIALAVFTSVSAVSIFNRNLVDRYANEDGRTAAAAISDALVKRTPVFIAPGYMSGAVRYYMPPSTDLIPLANAPFSSEPEKNLTEIGAAIAPGEPFMLLYTRAWDADPSGQFLARLKTLSKLELKQQVRGIALYEGRGWSR